MVMPISAITRRFVLAAPLVLLPFTALAAGIEAFVGKYEGSAEEIINNETKTRDLSVVIAQTEDGFSLVWTSMSYRQDGRTKVRTYDINFTPTQRDGIYGSAMRTNIFGKLTPLDPLRGEPYVWARLDGDTLSLFSLYISENGDYELQEYHRTLADGGLTLEFRRVMDGSTEREVEAFLKRVE